jgi:hypothetical protein
MRCGVRAGSLTAGIICESQTNCYITNPTTVFKSLFSASVLRNHCANARSTVSDLRGRVKKLTTGTTTNGAMMAADAAPNQ